MKEKHSYDLLYFVKNDFKFVSNDIDKVRKEHGKFGRNCFISNQKKDNKELLAYCAKSYLYNFGEESITKIYLIAFDLYDICIGHALFDCIVKIPEPEITITLKEIMNASDK